MRSHDTPVEHSICCLDNRPHHTGVSLVPAMIVCYGSQSPTMRLVSQVRVRFEYLYSIASRNIRSVLSCPGWLRRIFHGPPMAPSFKVQTRTDDLVHTPPARGGTSRATRSEFTSHPIDLVTAGRPLAVAVLRDLAPQMQHAIVISLDGIVPTLVPTVLDNAESRAIASASNSGPDKQFFIFISLQNRRQGASPI